MKRKSVWPCRAILCISLSIPVLAQTASVKSTRSDAHVDIEEYKAKMKVVDEKIKVAVDMLRAQPPNYDQAIATLTEAAHIAPDQDAIWYRLGVAYLGAANAEADAAEKTRRSTEAYNDLEKAIDVLRQRNSQRLQEGSSKPPCNVEGVCTHVETVKVAATSDNYKLAVYHSNLGDAAAKLGKNDEAIRDFEQAAQLDPADAATYYFNEGIILRNTAKSMDEKKQAAEAFDKAIAVDPNKAVAYYLKAEMLFGTATDSGGRIAAPSGTLEALQKYLELQPNGLYAAQARSLLVTLNSTVESNDGTNKEAPKKK